MRCQQFELYDAERRTPRGANFESIDAVQEYVDALRDTHWWIRNHPQVLRVEVGAASARADGSVGAWFPESNAGRIEMHPDHRYELVVLHELAHVLAEQRWGSRSHDPYFARTFLELVREFMGVYAYTALYEAFEAAGIQHDPHHDVAGFGRAIPL